MNNYYNDLDITKVIKGLSEKTLETFGKEGINTMNELMVAYKDTYDERVDFILDTIVAAERKKIKKVLLNPEHYIDRLEPIVKASCVWTSNPSFKCSDSSLCVKKKIITVDRFTNKCSIELYKHEKQPIVKIQGYVQNKVAEMLCDELFFSIMNSEDELFFDTPKWKYKLESFSGIPTERIHSTDKIKYDDFFDKIGENLIKHARI